MNLTQLTITENKIRKDAFDAAPMDLAGQIDFANNNKKRAMNRFREYLNSGQQPQTVQTIENLNYIFDDLIYFSLAYEIRKATFESYPYQKKWGLKKLKKI